MGRWRALAAMTRPTQVALILGIFTIGVMLALWRADGAATLNVDLLSLWPAAVLLTASAAAIHLANEAADYQTDRLTTRTAFSGGSGALEASGLNPRLPLTLSLATALMVVVGALVATTTERLNPAAALLLLLGLAGGLAYSLPPVAAERRGFGEALNAVLGAMILPLFGVAALAATLEPLDIVAFLPFLFVTFASVMATAWPDREADAATGKATMQVRLRPVVLRRVAMAAAAAFVVATLLSHASGAMPLALASLLVVPLLVVGLIRYTRHTSPWPNVAAMVGQALITLVVLVVALV
jgi:1,4-dihydroxy-2-naphthoate octaprenyltransferase